MFAIATFQSDCIGAGKHAFFGLVSFACENLKALRQAGRLFLIKSNTMLAQPKRSLVLIPAHVALSGLERNLRSCGADSAKNLQKREGFWSRDGRFSPP